MLPVNLQGLGKWELVYLNNLIPPPTQKTIEEFELPLLAENRFLIVGTRCHSARSSWIKAGYLLQVLENINVNDNVIFPGSGSPSNTADSDFKLVKLNATQLIVFPDFSSTYRLWFKPVSWIKDLTLAIWQFTETEIKPLDLLTQINNKLQ